MIVISKQAIDGYHPIAVASTRDEAGEMIAHDARVPLNLVYFSQPHSADNRFHKTTIKIAAGRDYYSITRV